MADRLCYPRAHRAVRENDANREWAEARTRTEERVVHGETVMVKVYPTLHGEPTDEMALDLGRAREREEEVAEAEERAMEREMAAIYEEWVGLDPRNGERRRRKKRLIDHR